MRILTTLRHCKKGDDVWLKEAVFPFRKEIPIRITFFYSHTSMAMCTQVKKGLTQTESLSVYTKVYKNLGIPHVILPFIEWIALRKQAKHRRRR